MKSTIVILCFTISIVIMTAVAFSKSDDRADVTVHEWGTFTSVAGEDGLPASWVSYGRPADLPCFVYNFGGFKYEIPSTVRMETPVLYFYGPRDASANVRVEFSKGTLTEWYPRGSGRTNNVLQWQNVRISPTDTGNFPTEPDASHYYAARETDAAPLKVGAQKEKFLFYRGVGTFPLPLSAQIEADGKILVKNIGRSPVEGLILFDNHGGKIQYAYAGKVANEITLDPESLQDNWVGLLMDLEHALITQGLYQKEARAMIKTWRDSWFEEGTRLFYIVPRPAVDEILPLDIQPAPSEIDRVFVGRMELITPATQQAVRHALSNNDRPALEKYGRFLGAIRSRIGVKSALLDSVYTSSVIQPANCKR